MVKGREQRVHLLWGQHLMPLALQRHEQRLDRFDVPFAIRLDQQRDHAHRLDVAQFDLLDQWLALDQHHRCRDLDRQLQGCAIAPIDADQSLRHLDIGHVRLDVQPRRPRVELASRRISDRLAHAPAAEHGFDHVNMANRLQREERSFADNNGMRRCRHLEATSSSEMAWASYTLVSMSDVVGHHLQFPRLRPMTGHPVTHEGQTYIALQDPTRLAPQAILLSEAGVEIAARFFDGHHDVATIAATTGVNPDVLRDLVQTMDEHGVLEGPTFEALLNAKRDEFDALQFLPIRAAFEFTAERIDNALQRASNGVSMDAARVRGIVVPHLDFDRGESNYALGYRAARDMPRPDRVVVLGTNHFGRSTGVVVCEKGCETNLGPVRCDDTMTRELIDALGPAIREHRYDHFHEHSIELQAPWIRHVFGDIPVVSALVHDPTFNDGCSYDGNGVDFDPFIDVMRGLLDDAAARGERTLLVASADLSHIGAEFGDDQPNSEQRLSEVATHDTAHLDMLAAGDVSTFLESMRTDGNSTRWCTLGGMTALWRLLPDSEVEILNYAQATDAPDGQCCVTSAAIVLGERE